MELLEKKTEKLREGINVLIGWVRKIYEYQVDPDYVHRKLTEVEETYHKSSLQLDGITEDKKNVRNVWS